MTGRRPLDGISPFQTACAYRKISDMLMCPKFTVYQSKIEGAGKQVGAGSEDDHKSGTAGSSSGEESRRFNNVGNVLKANHPS